MLCLLVDEIIHRVEGLNINLVSSTNFRPKRKMKRIHLKIPSENGPLWPKIGVDQYLRHTCLSVGNFMSPSSHNI